MDARFEMNGTSRKELVKAIGEVLGVTPKYLSVPTFAYEIGAVTVARDGAVSCEDEATLETVIQGLAAKDIALIEEQQEATESPAESETPEMADEVNTTDIEEPETADIDNDEIPEAADGDSTGEPTTSTDEGIRLTVEMPRDALPDEALEKLQRLVDSKAGLIKKALGTDSLPIEVEDDKVAFPWFAKADTDSTAAYLQLITALCEMASNATRVTAVEKPVDNEKYAFRCFLLRLGFIGDEYKMARKILLRNLTGSSAWKGGAPDAE